MLEKSPVSIQTKRDFFLPAPVHGLLLNQAVFDKLLYFQLLIVLARCLLSLIGVINTKFLLN